MKKVYGRYIVFKIYDCAGEDNCITDYNDIISKCDFLILVLDITRRETLDHLVNIIG